MRGRFFYRILTAVAFIAFIAALIAFIVESSIVVSRSREDPLTTTIFWIMLSLGVAAISVRIIGPVIPKILYRARPKTRCPKCYAKIDTDAGFCPKCGKIVDNSKSSNLARCPKCNCPIDDPDRQFCPECGSNLRR